jgi:hypothetical protein
LEQPRLKQKLPQYDSRVPGVCQTFFQKPLGVVSKPEAFQKKGFEFGIVDADALMLDDPAFMDLRWMI